MAATTHRVMKCAPVEVWNILADGWLYGLWVVGASRIRDVDRSWPSLDSLIHHSVGSWPLLINDTTSVVTAEPTGPPPPGQGLARRGRQPSRSKSNRPDPAAGCESPRTQLSGPAGSWRRRHRRPPQLGRPRTQMLPSLEFARRARVRHVVFLSLQGAEHNKVVPHARIEAWLRSSGLTWTFVRAAFFMQNLTTAHVTDIRDRNEIMVPAGRGATAFVDAHDVGDVATAALIDPEAHRNRAEPAPPPSGEAVWDTRPSGRSGKSGFVRGGCGGRGHAAMISQGVEDSGCP